jgi:hypothetical protein
LQLLETPIKVPLLGIEPKPQPPQGRALSAELQGYENTTTSLVKLAGRQGFEPWVEFNPHNRLAGGSVRPLTIKAEGEGFEPPVTTRATAVFKTAALNHSAIPPFS